MNNITIATSKNFGSDCVSLPSDGLMIIAVEGDMIHFVYSDGIEAAVLCSSVRTARRIFRGIKNFRDSGTIIITNARLIHTAIDDRKVIQPVETK